jgi:hypothetical protein
VVSLPDEEPLEDPLVVGELPDDLELELQAAAVISATTATARSRRFPF